MTLFCRVLLHAVTVLSLLLGTATVALWKRSYSIDDHFGKYGLAFSGACSKEYLAETIRWYLRLDRLWP